MATVELTGLVGFVNKLEEVCKKFQQRKDISEDNRSRFSKLQRTFKSVRLHLRELDKQSLDVHRKIELARFQSSFKERQSEIYSLQPDVESAEIFDRVRRMEQTLEKLEADVKEFYEFLTSIILPKLDHQDEVRIARMEYKPVSNVRPNPPHLTLDYNSKDTYEGQLKAAILDQLDRKIIGVIAHGQGGTGKTCALRGLAEDKDIKTTFPGGIFWIQLSNNSNVSTIIDGLATIARRTGNEPLARQVKASEMLGSAVDTAASWFHGQKCLFLIDNIWCKNGINYDVLTTLRTILSGESCCFAYTTRVNELRKHSDKVIDFRSRDPALSRRMLLAHAYSGAGEPTRMENQQAIEEILAVCAGLPFTLGIAGASVRNLPETMTSEPTEDAWAHYSRQLYLNRDIITSDETLDYGKLSWTVDASLTTLHSRRNTLHNGSEDYREKVRAPSIIRKRQVVPLATVRRLRNLGSLDKAMQLVKVMLLLRTYDCARWFPDAHIYV